MCLCVCACMWRGCVCVTYQNSLISRTGSIALFPLDTIAEKAIDCRSPRHVFSNTRCGVDQQGGGKTSQKKKRSQGCTLHSAWRPHHVCQHRAHRTKQGGTEQGNDSGQQGTDTLGESKMETHQSEGLRKLFEIIRKMIVAYFQEAFLIHPTFLFG